MEIGNNPSLSTLQSTVVADKPQVQKPAVVSEAKESNSVPSSVASPASNSRLPSPAEIEQKITSINEQLDANNQGLMFSVDKQTESSVIKLVDRSTDEVIKQFPSEDSLKIMNDIQKYLSSVNNDLSSGNKGLTGTVLNEII